MMALGILLFTALVLLGVITGARVLDAAAWRRELVALRLRLPSGLRVEAVATWLAAVTAGGSGRGQILDASGVLGVEIVATTAIEVYLLVPKRRQVTVLASLRAALPGVRLEPAPEHLGLVAAHTVATELRLSDPLRPLAIDRAEATVAAFLARLQPLRPEVEIRTQWLFTGSQTPTLEAAGPVPWRITSVFTTTPELTPQARRARQAKYAHPQLRAVGRISVTAPSVQEARAVLGQVAGTLRLMDAPGVSVTRRMLPSAWVGSAMRLRWLPLVSWPMGLNTREAVGLFGLAVGELHLPGLRLGAARQLPPRSTLPRRGVVYGTSNYPGYETVPIAQDPSDRLRHTWVIGPTGVGKTTLLANLALQDIARGDGVIVVDVLGDLVPEIIARTPQSRRDDLIVIDPSRPSSHAIGFNPLRGPNRELAVDHLMHILHELFRSSWGPRTAGILRAALLTLAYATDPAGHAFTILEIVPLLTNASFRRAVTRQSAVPTQLAEFWGWFERLSEAERLTVTASPLNKIRDFALREPVALLLGQSDGIDLSDVFARRRVLLVRLSKGELGEETSQLIGSLLVAALWQAAMHRATLDPAKRRPVWAYFDEFQDTVRLPLDLASMLSQARGLGYGITLAHQFIGQLSGPVKTAVLGTVRTQVTFQTSYDDATVLARSFAPLTRSDLMGLERYEIALRPCTDGRTTEPVTATTLPLPAATNDVETLMRKSQHHFGAPRTEIRDAIAARTLLPSTEWHIGRAKRGDSA